MAVNEEQRQVDLAERLSELARTLAHSTGDVPNPSDSYALLGELSAAQHSLAQVLEQLAGWHLRAEAGTHHGGQDTDGVIPAEVLAAAHLVEAADAARTAAGLVDRAHEESGTVAWFDAAREQVL